MLTISRKVDRALHLLREGRYAEIGKRVGKRIHERWTAYGLRRDLASPAATPAAKIPITVRPLRESDIPLLLGVGDASLPQPERVETEARDAHLKANIPTCYVAVDERDGKPCYMQWLMGAAENAKIQAFFGGRFPILREDEALLENAYTPLAYRGNGIMPAAMSLIAQRARDLGARYVITFVAEDNVPSLKGCRKAGFAPHLIRHDTFYCFRALRRLRFEPFPEGHVMPYERAA